MADDDIVTRLRHLAEYIYDNVGAGNAMVIAAAADDIQRLREMCRRWEECAAAYERGSLGKGDLLFKELKNSG